MEIYKRQIKSFRYSPPSGFSVGLKSQNHSSEPVHMHLTRIKRKMWTLGRSTKVPTVILDFDEVPTLKILHRVHVVTHSNTLKYFLFRDS